jgi:hypothetical protein
MATNISLGFGGKRQREPMEVDETVGVKMGGRRSHRLKQRRPVACVS